MTYANEEHHMAGNSDVVPVGAVPVQLSSNPTDNRSDQTIAVRPRDGNVTIGFDSTVAFGSGWLCGTGADADAAAVELALQPGEKLWAVADAATTVQVAVLEQGI